MKSDKEEQINPDSSKKENTVLGDFISDKKHPSEPLEDASVPASTIDSNEKIKSLEERLLRLSADFENYKKRAARENELVRELAASDLMGKILPFFDEFEIAISHLEAKDPEFGKGMKLVFGKLLDTLKRDGLSSFGEVGDSFDPHRHEAIRHIPGDDGKLVDVLLKGYMFKHHVLRIAKVSVGNGEKQIDRMGSD
ncbi:nucleotide exchange factor GrpE [Candidatus Micrarchaeota archaeon]|nr:nucleotide exchange factor GrpE [Candidatus Micrarchaeota archaeon]